jgi:monofunctional biosynthetic peptidoglycan transglycosylase
MVPAEGEREWKGRRQPLEWTVKKITYFTFAGILFFIVVFWFTLPNVSDLKKKNPKKTSFMEFREAEWQVAGQKKRIRQEWVAFSRISPFLIKAIIIAEDSKFWKHEGFDYEAIQAAIEKDLKLKKFKKGGSTITQQLAKNLYLTPEKSLFRKGREAAITWKIEKSLSKKRILELYLNVVEWGDGLFGVEAASRYYFGKPASDLTPMEASRLVSVLPNPRKYHPEGDQKYVLKRSEMIYQIMVERGIVLPEYEEMSREKEEPPPPAALTPSPSIGPLPASPFSVTPGEEETALPLITR